MLKMSEVNLRISRPSNVLPRTEGYNRYCWVWHLAGICGVFTVMWVKQCHVYQPWLGMVTTYHPYIYGDDWGMVYDHGCNLGEVNYHKCLPYTTYKTMSYHLFMTLFYPPKVTSVASCYVEALVATYSLMGLLIAQVLDCDGFSLVLGRKNSVSVLFLNRIETWFCMKRIFLQNYRIEMCMISLLDKKSTLW